MEDIKLESYEDLMAFLRQLPEQERFAALGVLNRLKKAQIDHIKATVEIKELFLRCGMAEESE